MKQKIICSVIMIFCILIIGINAYSEADDAAGLLNEYAELYGDVFENGLDGIASSENPINSDLNLNPTELLKKLNSGEIAITPKQILEYLLKAVMGEVYTGLKLMVTLLFVAVLSSYLKNLKSSFASESVASCAFYVCYTVMAYLAASAFYQAALCASGAIDNIAFFMKVMVPSMIAVLVTSGAVTSAAVLEPTLVAIVEIAVWVTDTVFVPTVMISAALNVVNGMSERFKTDNMIKLLNGTVKWGLSVMLTVFVGLTGLKSIAASGADGLSVKLGKFAASNLIPVVGGILSESVETVMNCSVVIKNSIGVLGIIFLLLIVLGPILKIVSILLIFRITAAVTEPISDKGIVVCVTRLADSVSVLFSILAAVTVMFIIIVTILINAGNNAVLLGR